MKSKKTTDARSYSHQTLEEIRIDAVRRVENNQKDKMSSLTAGMSLPPGFKLPF